uniref:Uncharacterized protein n=1 Tax=Desertifilum tharense IPPAS B-1220 TaxID=1781255 RepID=A0ACD5GXL6_9CYAN
MGVGEEGGWGLGVGSWGRGRRGKKGVGSWGRGRRGRELRVGEEGGRGLQDITLDGCIHLGEGSC